MRPGCDGEMAGFSANCEGGRGREKGATPATWLWSHGEGGTTGLGTAAVMAARAGQN